MGLRIVADCAQWRGRSSCAGAVSAGRLGGKVTLLNIEPNGRNINDGCGALHPKWVAAEVKKRGASIGLTFDGDADRCMLADATRQRDQWRCHSADGRARSADAWAADGQCCGGDDDVEHGPGGGAEAFWNPHAARSGWRSIRAGEMQKIVRRWAESSRGIFSSLISRRRAMGL